MLGVNLMNSKNDFEKALKYSMNNLEQLTNGEFEYLSVGDSWCIKINKECKYKDILFHISEVKLYDDGGEMNLSYTFNVLNGENLMSCEKFKEYIANFILNLISHGLLYI